MCCCCLCNVTLRLSSLLSTSQLLQRDSHGEDQQSAAPFPPSGRKCIGIRERSVCSGRCSGLTYPAVPDPCTELLINPACSQMIPLPMNYK